MYIAGSSFDKVSIFSIGPTISFFIMVSEIGGLLIIVCDIFEVSTCLQTAGVRHELPSLYLFNIFFFYHNYFEL